MAGPKGAHKNAQAQSGSADPANAAARAADPKQMHPRKPLNGNSSTPKPSASASNAAASEIQMEDDFVGKPDIEMAAEYIGEQKPGERYKQEGPACERPGAEGACQLESGYRHRTLEILNRHIGIAASTYQTAVQNARIDELLKKAPQIGLVAELVIAALGLVGGTLLNAAAGFAVGEANRRAVWNGAMKPGNFDSAVAAQTTQLKGVIGAATGIASSHAKQAFTGNTHEAQAKTAFLGMLQDQVPATLDDIVNRGLDSGDDVTLLLLDALFDPSVFTVTACEQQIHAMLDRLSKQHLDEIGPFKDSAVPGAGETEVVRLEAFGHHRLAVISFFHQVKLGRSYGEDWYTKSGDQFLNWVDDDFSDFATGQQESRNGAVKTIELSAAPDRFGGEVQAWVEKARKARV